MAYTYGETIAVPFWAEGRDFIGGRDPLGIQNSSVSIYSTLLPGLNNVTERLRYYGFYCWLLTCIEEKRLTFKEPREQHNFIRKAEYTLALYMALQEPGAGNIAGIDYANKQVHDASNKVFDIKKGAEKHPETRKGSVYWDFGSGALGQYYVGSLVLLGLIHVQDRYFFVTEEGKKMGAAFDKSINKEEKDFLFTVIGRGLLQRKDAGKLSAFSLQFIKPESEEWNYYINLFLSADTIMNSIDGLEQTTFRRDTWLMFISYLLKCESPDDWNSFPDHIYDNTGFIGAKKEKKGSIGWYYYCTNELIHFALESIFSVILKTIEQRPAHINKLTPLLTRQCLKTFRNYYSLKEDCTTSNLLENIDSETLSTEYPMGILDHLKIFNTGETLAWSFELILKVYRETMPYREYFSRFTYETDTRDKRGTALELFEEHIEVFIEKPVALFIERTINKIINDHLYVAYLKMGNGEGQVHKLLLEDNYLVHIANINPRFTTPRLGTVRNFLHDLNLVKIQNNKYKLTEAGKAIYDKFNQ